MKYGVGSLQLPVRYPQLPANLIGQIETFIWRIHLHVFSIFFNYFSRVLGRIDGSLFPRWVLSHETILRVFSLLHRYTFDKYLAPTPLILGQIVDYSNVHSRVAQCCILDSPFRKYLKPLLIATCMF